ncbi:Phosphate starvation-inducible ATPase PhoH [Salmonella enterica subsp. enterica serovar Mississippi str. A4-633]|nr:Phosphate starvation-inducible ATPase PhoH [Salmonella enterica subsp. enterica serovar Mississippi str. A4-633]
MGRQKAVIKARREAKRVLRRDSRSHKQREEESVTSLVQMGGVEAIGMARDSRDTSPVKARNEAQAHYLNAIDSKQLIFATGENSLFLRPPRGATGEAGCGKTWISAAKAAEALIHKDVERIIVTRPVLQADEDLGFLPGDIAEKFAPYFRPVYDVLLKRLGASFMQYCLRPEIGKVEIAPFAYMRGRTFENAVVILDEAQNVTAAQMKMFLTRLGENVTVIVNGDITQCDLPRGVRSGLSDALERFEEDEMVGIVHFNKDDCVRSALCQRTLHAYS